MTLNNKHPADAIDSFKLHAARQENKYRNRFGGTNHRYLKKDVGFSTHDIEEMKNLNIDLLGKQKGKKTKKRTKKMKELWANPGISESTVHGLMIDAGSSGSRLHLYEWEPRILEHTSDIQEALSGRKFSIPGTETRWSDRLRPGLNTLAEVPDDELVDAAREYLAPLLEFAKVVLHDKMDNFSDFPIFLRATAGMRTLSMEDRAGIMKAIRTVFSDKTYCPFYFEYEHARVLSGEEEAVYDWAGVNFLLGNLVIDSEGSGTVQNPRLTYGALDMGGASTQISFYEPNEDIMSSLFKFQIGQGKHWNIYAHSYLYYGIDQASNRLDAKLVVGHNETERSEGIYNPCLPGGSTKEIKANIHLDTHNTATWNYSEPDRSEDGFLEATLINENDTGDYEECTKLVQELLNLEKNDWCNYSHQGDCAFAGVYQPKIPRQSKNFGEFLAFSNYVRVWTFLDLPEKASLSQLEKATKQACSLSKLELDEFASGKKDLKAPAIDYCFRSVYVFQLLHYGYGFEMEDHITASEVINDHKVSWALGAMLYEINTMPWRFSENHNVIKNSDVHSVFAQIHSIFLSAVVLGLVFAICTIYFLRRRRNTEPYVVLKRCDDD